MNNEENMLMDWNDSIETDGQEFVLLPEGGLQLYCNQL